MELAELFLLAIEALRRNVGRTLLTMLGIIIGVSSVVLIMWFMPPPPRLYPLLNTIRLNVSRPMCLAP